MEPVVVLLVFVLLAAATVAISVIVQHRLSRGSDADEIAQVSDVGTGHGDVLRRQPEDAGVKQTISSNFQSSTKQEAELRQARAAELEAVADRERRYAERAEAEARRLRAWDDATPVQPPSDPPARRAGIAPEDLDY